MYGIVKHRSPPKPNAIFCNVRKKEMKFMDLPCDSDLFQNLMAPKFIGPCYALPPNVMEIGFVDLASNLLGRGNNYLTAPP